MLTTSKFLNGGAPSHCANPSCKEPFVRDIWRGQDNRYYCSKDCEEFAQERIPQLVQQ
jgi:hypothetical protein